MPIDPNMMKQKMQAAKQTGSKLNAGAAQSQMRNKQQQGMAMRNPNAIKQPGIAKPNIGQPATPLGVNKKKPLLAPGSVRANAARGQQEMMKQKMMMQAAQQPALDLAPTQLPFEGSPDMGVIPEVESAGINVGGLDPGMMPPSIPGQLDLKPTQLPFNPNSGIAGMDQGKFNPMNSQPGQFGQVDPATQQRMMMQRQQAQMRMRQQQDMMNQSRMRGGY